MPPMIRTVNAAMNKWAAIVLGASQLRNGSPSKQKLANATNSPEPQRAPDTRA